LFETAELAHRIDKATWKAEEPQLRQDLLDAQFELLSRQQFPVLILLAGVEGAGKSEIGNLLNEWMDPRHIHTHAFDLPGNEENERPYMYRYWTCLPPKGCIGIYFGAWHSMPVVTRAFDRISKDEFDHYIETAQRMERMLTDEGMLLIKFWFHLTKDQQKKRLEELASKKATRWRVGEHEWSYFARYDDFVKASDHFVRETSTGQARWYVVNGSDPRYRALTVGKTLLTAIRTRLAEGASAAPPVAAPPLIPSVDSPSLLHNRELDRELAEEKYEKQLEKWQGRLN